MEPTDSATERIERALDDALAMTFPASDPVALSAPPDTAASGPRADRARRGPERS
jgi:hypothetical protein